MKKTLAFILAAIMLFSLVSCEKNRNADEDIFSIIEKESSATGVTTDAPDDEVNATNLLDPTKWSKSPSSTEISVSENGDTITINATGTYSAAVCTINAEEVAGKTLYFWGERTGGVDLNGFLSLKYKKASGETIYAGEDDLALGYKMPSLSEIDAAYGVKMYLYANNTSTAREISAVWCNAILSTFPIHGFVPYGQNASQVIDNVLDNVLYRKKWAACGDSFTYGDFGGSTDTNIFKDGLYIGSNKTYPYYIARRNRMTVVNCAMNGATLANIQTNSFTHPSSLIYYQNIPADVDYITIWFGINDKNYSVPIGSIDSTDNTTFMGAWNEVLTWIRNNRPKAHVVIVCTNGCVGHEEYPDASRTMAQKYGYPYLDIDKGADLPLMLLTNRTDVTADAKELVRSQQAVVPYADSEHGIKVNNHPNAAAHELESYFIEDFLRNCAGGNK